SALRVTLVRWQHFLEPQLDAYQAGGATFAPSDIGKGSELTRNQLEKESALSTALRRRGFADKARDLDAAMTAFSDTIAGLTPLATGSHLTVAQFDLIVSAE